MKNNEVIQIAALVLLAGALLYRKYGKKKQGDQADVKKASGKSLFSAHSAADDYEPYSNKGSDKE